MNAEDLSKGSLHPVGVELNPLLTVFYSGFEGVKSACLQVKRDFGLTFILREISMKVSPKSANKVIICRKIVSEGFGEFRC